MHNTIRRIFPILAVGLVALLVAGCSPSAKKAKALEKADKAFAAARYNEAEIEYKNVLQIENLNAHAIVRLGTIYSDQGRLGLAVLFIRKARELAPDDLFVRLKMGQLNLASGKLKEAQDEAMFVLTRQPGDPEAPLLLAACIGTLADANGIKAKLEAIPNPARQGAPVLTALGMVEFRLSHNKEAEALFQAALAADPKFAAAHSAMGLLRLGQEDIAGADAELKQSADLSPARSPRRIQYVQFKIRNRDLETAKKLLAELNQQAPDYIPAWLVLAEIYANENKLKEASELLDKALALDPEHVEAHILRGRIYLAQKDYPKAVQEFERLASAFPKMPNLHYELGRAYAAAGDPEKAVGSLEQAVNLAPNYAEALVPLATLYIRKGDLSNAVLQLRKVVQQRPNLILAQLLLADAYRGQGHFEDAIDIYLEVEAKTKNAQAPLLRGQLLMQQKKYAEARAAFNRALELAPEDPAPQEQLATLDLTEGHYDAARKRIDAYIAANPKQGGPYILLAKVFVAMGDVGQAEGALKKSIELQPDSPNAYYLLAGLYFSSNQHQKALANLANLIARNPNDKQALLLTGVLQDELKNRPAAREAYEKLLKVDPRSATALNNLAYLYSEFFNDLDRAQELGQRARDAAPDEPHVADTFGWILFKKRQYPRAVAMLDECASKLIDSPEVQYHLGMAQYMMGNESAAVVALQRAMVGNANFTGAEEARDALAILKLDSADTAPSVRALLEKAVAARPDDPVANARLAGLYEKDGKTDKALAACQAALQSNPANAKVLLTMVRLYTATKDYAKALDTAKNARKAAPTDPAAAYALGRLVFRNGDYQWATSLLQETVRGLPNDEEAQFDFAVAAYSVGRTDDASAALHSALEGKSAFTRTREAHRMLDLMALADQPNPAGIAKVGEALKANPNDVAALMAQAAISGLQGNAKLAKESYEKALEVYPDFSPAKRGLAIYYSRNPSDDQKAYELALKARSAFPDDAELAKAFGIISYRRNDFSRAASLLAESAQKLTDDAETFYYLGVAQAQLKRKSPAQESLRRALSLGLKGEPAEEARKILATLK